MIPFAFFGTSRFSVILLEKMKALGITPSLIITAPDRPVGRKQVMTAPPIKAWAEKNNIAVLQPEKLKDTAFIDQLRTFELFIVASYGKIIPKEILDLPKLGILNVHPSLLPKYRGASPIQNQILANEQHIGTTIMHMDKEMDHGDIIMQKVIQITPFPAPYDDIEESLAKESATLLVEVLPLWISGSIKGTSQDHVAATYTKIIEKADGETSLSADPVHNYLKYLAYHSWPKTFFFFEKEGKKLRAIITDAALEDGQFVIKKVIPEGKNEMDYEAFLIGIDERIG